MNENMNVSNINDDNPRTNSRNLAVPAAVSNHQHHQLELEVEPPPAEPPQQCRKRMGTIQSATFNIWSTMVGGGSLSLPLAFTKTGNILIGPMLLILTAVMTEFCFGILIDTTYFINDDQPQQQPNHHHHHHQRVSTSTSTATTAPTSEIGNETVHESNGNDVEGEVVITQHEHPDEDDNCTFCSNHTLESITAAAAAAAAATVTATATVTNENHPTTTISSSTDDAHHNTNVKMAYTISALLVFFMCFFGIIGYCVLLRDMLLPVTKFIQQQQQQQQQQHYVLHQSQMDVGDIIDSTVTNETTVTWANNLSMIIVVFIVTPLCTLQTLTALQKFSTLSMCSVLILGLCIVYRSVQCHLGYYHNPSHDSTTNTTNTTSSFMNLYKDLEIHNEHSSNGRSGFTWFPHHIKDVLDVLPLYISCYVCHYNIPVVCNDFAHPTPTRVRLWLHITVWGATIFYCIIGIAGSSFALVCGGHNQVVQGNVLLNFDPDDPLLLVGRLCLAVTIALAFPVLTIPARDIILRYMISSSASAATTSHPIVSDHQVRSSLYLDDNSSNTLTEPLLVASSNENELEEEDATVHTSNVLPSNNTSGGTQDVTTSTSTSTWVQRLLVSMCVLWSGTSIASCVSSIDIVWDFLGSSLSIVLSYLVPCGCYIALRRRYENTRNTVVEDRNDYENLVVRDYQSIGNWLPSIPTFCWILISFFTPLMFISTANAIYNLLSSK